MSASMTMPEQIDGLEKLITLASLRKEDIIATQQEARKQLQLTQEEQGKVAEAKSYIAQHAALIADMQRREDEMLANRAEYNKNVKEFDAHVASENTRLETFSATLTVKEKQQTEVDKRQRAEDERLAGLRIDQERQHQNAMTEIQKQAAADADATKANEIEAERLKNWEITLKKKAQALREQAANF